MSQNLDEAIKAAETAVDQALIAHEAAVIALETARALHNALRSNLNVSAIIEAADEANHEHVFSAQVAQRATTKATRLCKAGAGF